MAYEDDYKMWLEKMLIESSPDWVCDGMYDMGFTHEWCEKYCGEDSEYVTSKCLHMYYHHIVKADRKTEPTQSQHVQHVGSVETTQTDCWSKEKHEKFYTFLWNIINPNEMQEYIEMFEPKTEPQTERSE